MADDDAAKHPLAHQGDRTRLSASRAEAAKL